MLFWAAEWKCRLSQMSLPSTWINFFSSALYSHYTEYMPTSHFQQSWLSNSLSQYCKTHMQLHCTKQDIRIMLQAIFWGIFHLMALFCLSLIMPNSEIRLHHYYIYNIIIYYTMYYIILYNYSYNYLLYIHVLYM